MCIRDRHWFNEWNTRGKVIIWDIKQFFHKENQTVVEWYFKNEMNTGSVEEFDGISLIESVSYTHLHFGYSRACGKMQETGIYRKVQKL